MAINPFSGHRDDPSSPAQSAETITPHDTNELTTVTKAIYVGGAGDITCRLNSDGADVVFKAVPVGMILPICVTHVRSTGTTATFLVALF